MNPGTLEERFELSQRPSFRNRVEMAACVLAAAVASESDSTPNHAARLAFATDVSRNARTYVHALTRAVASDDAVAVLWIQRGGRGTELGLSRAEGDVTDDAVLAALSARWDLFAGSL